ncbi:MAG: two-component sensor histidine kinase [Deltaproteobacteria bacterium]|nr:two-component sensor histidine kinase [Deltaproteobacteria bacterium]
MAIPNVNSPEFYVQLKRHFVKILLLSSFVPLILIGGISYYYLSATLKESSRRYLASLVRDHQIQIDSFLTERLSNLKVVSKSYTFGYLLKGDHLPQVLDIFRGEYGTFTDVGVIDAQGNHVAYEGPYDLLGKNYKDAAHIIMAVKREGNGRTWILRTTIDTGKFTELVEGIRIGETGDAFIVNTEGIFQTRPRGNGDLLKKSAFLPGEYFRETRLEERRDEFGTESLYAYTWLHKRNWCLVVKQDLREVYAALRYSNYVVVPVLFFGTLIIVFAALFTTRQMAERIEKADQEKDLLNKQLLQSSKLAAIGAMAAGVAHEINNPLAIVGEEAGWMNDLLKKEGLKESPNIKEFEDSIDQIKKQARRCRRITHNLLCFSRKLEPKVGNVRLNSLIEEVVVLVEREAKVNGITITRNYDDNLSIIWTDGSELRQVFLNIITNAIDSIKATGRIAGEITITTRLKGEKHISAEITDTGHGISKEHLDEIFIPFFTTKPPGKGTGLGLSICYGVIEKLGGKIKVESEEGEGTTFNILLPIGEKDNGEAAGGK